MKNSTENWTKNIKRKNYTANKKETQMAIKHMNKYSTSHWSGKCKLKQ